jgi:hypothetical protein
MTIPDFFEEFLRIFIQEISKIPNLEYEVRWKTPIRTKWYQMQLSSLYVAKVMVIPDFFEEFLRIFIQENSKIPNFEYEVRWRTSIRTKWHQVLLPSLQLAKVMAIPKFEIWVLLNFCSKKFKILKFWVCHFLTITKIHLSLEHINTLKSILHMILAKSVFFKIWNLKILLKKFQNFKIPKMACTTSAQTTIVPKISALYLLMRLRNGLHNFLSTAAAATPRDRRNFFFRSKHAGKRDASKPLEFFSARGSIRNISDERNRSCFLSSSNFFLFHAGIVLKGRIYSYFNNLLHVY